MREIYSPVSGSLQRFVRSFDAAPDFVTPFRGVNVQLGRCESGNPINETMIATVIKLILHDFTILRQLPGGSAAFVIEPVFGSEVCAEKDRGISSGPLPYNVGWLEDMTRRQSK